MLRVELQRTDVVAVKNSIKIQCVVLVEKVVFPKDGQICILVKGNSDDGCQVCVLGASHQGDGGILIDDHAGEELVSLFLGGALAGC